jgi:SsrA-binding protein
LHHLIGAKQQGLNIIPIKLLTEGRYIKVVIGVGRGRKKYDKRHINKKRDEERSINRLLKGQ